jgi:UPF0716 protein FxsA
VNEAKGRRLGFIGKFFLLVCITGAVELYVLVGASAHLGLAGTAALCVLTGVVGGAIVRQQGLATLVQIQREMARGVAPAREIASGVVLLLVGGMLITPGFITDALGFTLLVPAVRHRIAEVALRVLRARVQVVEVSRMGGGRSQSGPMKGSGRGRVIDVEPDPD